MWWPAEPFPPELEPSVFLISIWKELFDPYTPDTFQPRLHNVTSLVDELCDVSARLDSETIWWKHVNQIRLELKQVSQEEADLLEKVPEYRWQLGQLQKSQKPREIQTSCRLLIQRREEYDKTLIASIQNCAEGLPKEKRGAYKALRRLATVALQKLQSEIDIPGDLVSPLTEPQRIVEYLVGAANPVHKTYECVFAIIGVQRYIQRIIHPIGFKMVSDHNLPADQVQSLATEQGEISFVQCAVTAPSPREAARTSRQLLRTATDIFNLYMNSVAVTPTSRVFIRSLGDDQYVFLEQSEQAFRRLFPRSRASIDTTETLDMVTRKQAESRLLSALELHSLAIANSEPRLKLINLWSALECLAGSCDEQSVIGRVINLAAPLLVWRRVDKTVRYVSIATKNLGDSLNNYAYGSGFARSRENYVDPWDMMQTLCRPDGHADILSLLEYSSKHPLLVHRIYRLWQELHDPKALRTTLMRSRDRIEWQLWRIYRARNLLVHHGYEVPHLGVLLDHLQYYTSIVIQRIIHGMKTDNSWGVRESLEYWNSKSKYILDFLTTNPEKLTVSDFFPTRDSKDPPLLWQ